MTLRQGCERKPLNIKDIVKDKVARFSFYRAGYAFYEVEVEGTTTATLMAEHKAITLMRYIRKALETNTFVKA
jgi:hypothetical protein